MTPVLPLSFSPFSVRARMDLLLTLTPLATSRPSISVAPHCNVTRGQNRGLLKRAALISIEQQWPRDVLNFNHPPSLQNEAICRSILHYIGTWWRQLNVQSDLVDNCIEYATLVVGAIWWWHISNERSSRGPKLSSSSNWWRFRTFHGHKLRMCIYRVHASLEAVSTGSRLSVIALV